MIAESPAYRPLVHEPACPSFEAHTDRVIAETPLARSMWDLEAFVALATETWEDETDAPTIELGLECE